MVHYDALVPNAFETRQSCKVKNPRIKLQIKGRIKLFLTLMQHDSRGVGEGDGEVPIGFRAL